MRRLATRPSAALVAVVILLTACGGSSGVPADPISAPGTLPVTSPAFSEGAMIPVRSTCDGEDTSPSLAWSVPVSVAEWAITMEDLDAGFVHWVAYGIPGQTSGLLEGRLPPGSRQGRNDFGDIGYGGPCPPREDEPHRYRFTVYALERARGGQHAGGGHIGHAARRHGVLRPGVRDPHRDVRPHMRVSLDVNAP